MVVIVLLGHVQEQLNVGVNIGLQGCDAMLTGKWVSTFWTKILPVYSELK